MAKSPTEFSRMYPTRWTGKTGKALKGDAEAQALQGYLVDGPHSNMWGLYYLPKAYITHDTGHSPRVIDRVFKKLAELDFAYYDEATEYVFVVKMAEIQVGELKEKDNRRISANTFYKNVAENPFLGAFYDRYANLLCLTTLRRGSEGGSKGVMDPLARGPNDADDDADDTADVGVDEKNEKKLSKPGIDRGRRFSDDPMHLVNLWNEKAPHGHNRVHTVTEGLKAAIRKAYRQVPERHQWEGIIQEIEMSEFLCGKKFVNLDWVLKTKDGESVENYAKIMNGNYRDNGPRGLSKIEQNNLEIAKRFLARGDQSALMEDYWDGPEGSEGISETPLALSDGTWGEFDRGATRDLLPGADGLTALEHLRGDELGPEEY